MYLLERYITQDPTKEEILIDPRNDRLPPALACFPHESMGWNIHFASVGKAQASTTAVPIESLLATKLSRSKYQGKENCLLQ
jgi:hypothetical protein